MSQKSKNVNSRGGEINRTKMDPEKKASIFQIIFGTTDDEVSGQESEDTGGSAKKRILRKSRMKGEKGKSTYEPRGTEKGRKDAASAIRKAFR